MSTPRRNTPQLLRMQLGLLWAAVAILIIAALVSVYVHRSGMQTVGRNTAPSIVAAQHIKVALAGMDAEAANALLSARGRDDDAMKAYDAYRQEAAGALIGAAENITYGEAERGPIRELQLGAGTYEAKIQRSRDLYERRDPNYIDAYLEAARLMDTALLPAADRLDKANLDVLEAEYEKQGFHSVLTRGIVVVAAIILLFALVSVQSFLSNRTNRTLNLPLVVATLIALAWAGWMVATLSEEQRHLKVARQDAFVSIHALWRARSTAYRANAQQSRFLLDKSGAKAADTLFREEAASIGNELAKAANNITFEGEREAVAKARFTFSAYRKIDDEVRRLEIAGRHPEAITLCLGDSNKAFDAFDRALAAPLAINQTAFDRAVVNGFGALQYFELKASLAAVAIALLVLLGLIQRIAEYR